MPPSRSRHAPPAALAAALSSLILGCGAPPSPPRLTPPIAIGTGGVLTEVPVEPTTQASTPTVLDLVDGDGELLLRLDLRALRSSLLFRVAVKLLKDGPRDLQKVRQGCGLDPFEVVDELAVAMHDLDRDQPLFVAKLSITAERAMECIRTQWTGGETQMVAGREAYRLDDYRRSPVALAEDDLLFVGSPTDVSRALGRRKAASCVPVNLRAQLATGPDIPFAVVLETGNDEVARVSARLATKDQRLDLAGEIWFRDQRNRSGTEYAERAQRDFEEGREDIRRALEQVLGAGHPLLAELDSLVIRRDDAHLKASIKITPDLAMLKALEGVVDHFGRREHTSKAKNIVAAIARGAAAAYEREIMGPRGAVSHTLCGSATDVPATVPRGVEYLPSTATGQDYDSGDAQRGWSCLKFSLSQPQRYQYSYREGGGYKGPARGGPNPGPHGFEVSAEGDLDGDGKTSLFTRTGTVDPLSGTLRLSPQVFVADEYE